VRKTLFREDTLPSPRSTTRFHPIPNVSPVAYSSVIISIRGGGSDSPFIELVFTVRAAQVYIYVAVERAMKY